MPRPNQQLNQAGLDSESQKHTWSNEDHQIHQFFVESIVPSLLSLVRGTYLFTFRT